MQEPSHLEGEAEITGAPGIDIVLAPLAPSVGQARHAVGALLRDFPHVPILVIEDVLLLVSELVTNAVLHAGTELRVMASVQTGLVSVSVGDGDPLHAPELAERGTNATSGRGVMLVNALASDWGVELDEGWKVVWFHASYEPGAAADPQGSADEILSRRWQRREGSGLVAHHRRGGAEEGFDVTLPAVAGDLADRAP